MSPNVKGEGFSLTGEAEGHWPGRGRLRERLFEVIFRADTSAGRLFDLALICCVLLSVLIVMLDSVESLATRYGAWFSVAEWTLTGLFTLEYLARLYCVRNPGNYARSFYGVVDLVAILPSFMGLMFTGLNYLMVVRVFRILRIFRVLKMVQFTSQMSLLMQAVSNSRSKITVFFLFIVTVVVAFGCVMYVIEGPENGFTSIPLSIYWAVVTLTTVGYGDIYPHTILGKMVSTLVMITGYAVIAVPTGIFTAELSQEMGRSRRRHHRCEGCGHEWHETHAKYCLSCGLVLPAKP